MMSRKEAGNIRKKYNGAPGVPESLKDFKYFTGLKKRLDKSIVFNIKYVINFKP